MFPYSPEAAEDEPTMTDLRGVLPAQRPPVDATVLDEPTSEVPMIRPPAGYGRNGEVERPGAAEPAEVREPEPADTAVLAPAETDPAELETETAELVPADTVELEADTADLAPADPADPADLAQADPAELTAGAEPDAAPILAHQAAPTTHHDRVWNDDPALPDPADPEVPEMAEPNPPHRISEMAKMTWSPAAPPFNPPEPVTPVAAPSLAAPAAELTGGSVDLADPAGYTGPTTVTEPAGYTGPTTPTEPDLVTEAVAATEPETVTVTEPEPATEPEAVAEPEAAAEPVPSPAPAPKRPGDVAESTIALWSTDAADRLRDQWRDLQVQFIDDPEAAVAGAKGLVTEAVHELADTLLEAQDALDPYREESRTDTETMRVAMRRYREFLERVLAL